MSPRIGQAQLRVDGRAKVTGQALYPADAPQQNPAWAFLITSEIARGRILSFDLSEARAIPGVIDILTHETVGTEAKRPRMQAGGDTTTSMENAEVWHDGQIIGIILAETYEIARDAAHRVSVAYAETPPAATFDQPGVVEEWREPGEHEDYEVGDVDAAFASADVVIDALYETPTQHHNPIELFSTTAAWSGDQLTVWEPSQFVYGLRGNLAHQLGIAPERIRVISQFVGGAFGSKGGATARTAWIAVAARRIGRPVKLVATRDQGYTIATYRAETRHRLTLAADGRGRLLGLRHEGAEVTSRPSVYNVSGTETTARLYACPNIRTRVKVVHADRNTPGFMRAPPDTPYMFPLESAMDELAERLRMDPVELRRLNDTATDPTDGAPYTSRHLMRCFDEASAHFGWNERPLEPGAMSRGDWRIGWGCASAAYPSNIAAAAARVRLRPNGTADVELAGHELGTGAYTVAAIAAAARLGIEIDHVTVRMGDSTLPPTALAAGSSHTATITHAIAKACDALVARIAAAAVASGDSPCAGQDPAQLALADGALGVPGGPSEPLAAAVARVSHGAVEVYAEHAPPGLPPDALDTLYAGQLPILRGQQRKTDRAYAFGAHMVEVMVHRRTAEIRVARMVSAFASGTIVNPLTAHSQYVGGMIWGLGAALLEKTEIDLRHARYVNDNISEYLVAVNADVAQVEAILVPEEDDRVNDIGIKGLGELGIVGMNAAIANAVWHATGRRVRRLPIRIEDLL
ncbi:xanthine dehydrogenase family protein molybdopterin-binding subunit [Acidisoma sp. 7E03]